MEEEEKRKDFRKKMFAMILPVLFYEYLAMSITKSLVPGMVIEAFGDYSYFAVGVMETIKGILAFLSCPLFGKLSDKIGRKYCLLATVVGTTLPVCILAFTSNMYIFAVAMSLSGFFSATFPLTFAYISDCVERKKRAPAYGLALATFGLSFCLGPISGSYLASQLGSRAVFITSLILVLVNIVYIIFFLPESVRSVREGEKAIEKLGVAIRYLPNSWNFSETFRVFRRDPFMSNLALIVFLYYTSVWAVVSTLMVYVTRHLNFSAMSLGWLLTGYGVATMTSEGILVRIIVPWLGETASMRLGLLAFAAQCVVLAFSSDPVWIFVSVLFSMLANLVYPSISSLVSKVVTEDMQGEALGALNGIKAVTEGFGPLVFGLMMALFEDAPIPGAPYLVASVVSFWAFLHCYELPPEPEISIGKDIGEGEGASLLSESGSWDESDSDMSTVLSVPSSSSSSSSHHASSSILTSNLFDSKTFSSLSSSSSIPGPDPGRDRSLSSRLDNLPTPNRTLTSHSNPFQPSSNFGTGLQSSLRPGLYFQSNFNPINDNNNNNNNNTSKFTQFTSSSSTSGSSGSSGSSSRSPTPHNNPRGHTSPSSINKNNTSSFQSRRRSDGSWDADTEDIGYQINSTQHRLPLSSLSLPTTFSPSPSSPSRSTSSSITSSSTSFFPSNSSNRKDSWDSEDG